MFDRKKFVADVRSAESITTISEILIAATRNLCDPSHVDEERGDTEILFEDDAISIWHCRFDPSEHVPPHDHQTQAVIGVYQGAELNHFYRPLAASLEHIKTREIHAGDVIVIEPDEIHSVECKSSEPSYALHVYLAKLTEIERSLYDWDSGIAIPMSEAAYNERLRTL